MVKTPEQIRAMRDAIKTGVTQMPKAGLDMEPADQLFEFKNEYVKITIRRETEDKTIAGVITPAAIKFILTAVIADQDGQALKTEDGKLVIFPYQVVIPLTELSEAADPGEDLQLEAAKLVKKCVNWHHGKENANLAHADWLEGG